VSAAGSERGEIARALGHGLAKTYQSA
jgi:hypothetical protein